jgi:hypothetical protein
MSDASPRWAGWANALLLIGAAVVQASSTSATEQLRLAGGARPRIVNGLTTHAYPATAALLNADGVPITLDNAELQCSATLIGCSTVLTAAHCVDDDPLPGHYLVYLQHAGLFTVSSIAIHPGSAFPVADIAVLKLGEPVSGIDPAPLNLVDPAPFIPITGTIVGFGQTQGGANDYGIKRIGGIETTSCTAGLPNGAGDDELVCWDFLSPIGTPGVDSNTCNGDSGGPLFLNLGGGETVAGVTSGGTSFICLPTDHSYDASVYTYSSYILGELGGDPTGPCGGLPPVGDPAVDVAGYDGSLDGSHLSDSYSVPVPAGKNTVRFALNGEDNGGFGIDMYVKAGPGASPASFDCKADGGSVFGACVFDLPAAASYSVFLLRTSGAGDYQLTVTTFGGGLPVCGDNVRTFNEDCDGTDDAQCDGLCQPGCTCPAPVCGNNIREQDEACDGSDASQCPGECAGDCTCPLPCQTGGMFPIRLRTTPERLRFRATLTNFFGEFDGQDPRSGFSLAVTQGANTVTVDIPADDPGWADSDVAKRKFKWRGNTGGVTRIKVIDRPGQGVLKVIVVGKNVSGTAAIDDDLAVDVTLTLDEKCVDQTF